MHKRPGSHVTFKKPSQRPQLARLPAEAGRAGLPSVTRPQVTRPSGLSQAQPRAVI